jgi:diguanylate cyclase (GGDEF)-like protein
MTAVLLARVHAHGGPPAVAELLRGAGSTRSPEYLLDIGNWISHSEAQALWQAGAQVTHHPEFARAVGEDAVRRLTNSPVAALFRSLGSPERLYSEIAATSGKYTVITRMEAVRVEHEYAEIVAHPVEGFPRDPLSCAWTRGLLTQPPVLFGLAPAKVEHEECAAFGAPTCVYRITWGSATGELPASSEHALALHDQLEAMQDRLRSMYATASDLIGTDNLADVLARITDRAAFEVRAPRYLLAVRTSPGGEIHCHGKGFDAAQAAEYGRLLLDGDASELPESWLVVAVKSNRRDYGRLLAACDEGKQFFPQEHDLLEVYARYAATALDSATALTEARRRYAQSIALLDLARELAEAGTSGEIASRLADAVPAVVDCDRVGVYLWDAAHGTLVRRALSVGGAPAGEESDWSLAPSPAGPLERLLNTPNQQPIFIDSESGDPLLRERFSALGALATIVVPLASADHFLGLLAVSVMERPDRLEPCDDLLDRLSGVAAQATTALQNGRLVDEITYQAMHDPLTGLANRAQFTEVLREAIVRARLRSERVTLLYIDLDGFKPVNDQFGHDAGDTLLVAVGERLTSCTRAADVVARLGGDEFAVLLDSSASAKAIDALSVRLENAFTRPFVIDGRGLRLGASVGRAVFPDDADGAEGLLRAADRAMFEAKRGAVRAAPVMLRRR